jgi:hypothetical protein
VLGGEGAHGVLILGPRAVERLESHTPPWPLPKVFRLVSKGALNEGVFKGETINTPSMLAVEDAIWALEWAKGLGGLSGLRARSDANAAALDRIVAERPWLGHLAADPATRSKTSVCLTVEAADAEFIKRFAALLEGEGAAVVNFSSTSAMFAHPYMAAYAASKGGVQSMTHALAAEYAKQGIRFNSVQPGSISSGMTDGSGESKQSQGPGLPDDADLSLFMKLAPAIKQGFAGPEAVAGVVAMLASEDGAFVTGTEVRIDGGTHF